MTRRSAKNPAVEGYALLRALVDSPVLDMVEERSGVARAPYPGREGETWIGRLRALVRAAVEAGPDQMWRPDPVAQGTGADLHEYVHDVAARLDVDTEVPLFVAAHAALDAADAVHAWWLATQTYAPSVKRSRLAEGRQKAMGARLSLGIALRNLGVERSADVAAVTFDDARRRQAAIDRARHRRARDI